VRAEKEVEDWACEALRGLTESIDYLAVNPGAYPDWVKEFFGKLPDLVDAFLAVVKEEYRPVVHELISAIVALVKLWRKKRYI